MAMLGQFLCVSRNFDIYDGLGPGLRDDVTALFKDSKYLPEIWWDDAQYREADVD